jgi:hypothetical protein
VVVWVVQEQVKDGFQTGTSSEQRVYFRNIGFGLFQTLIMARYGLRVPPDRRYGLPPEEAFILSKGKPTTVNLWRDKLNKHKDETKTSYLRLPNGEKKQQADKWTVGKYGRRPNV